MGCWKSKLILIECLAKDEISLGDTSSSLSSKLPNKYRSLTIDTEIMSLGFRTSTPSFGFARKIAVDAESDVQPFQRSYIFSYNIEYTHTQLRDIMHLKPLIEAEVCPEDS